MQMNFPAGGFDENSYFSPRILNCGNPSPYMYRRVLIDIASFLAGRGPGRLGEGT